MHAPLAARTVFISKAAAPTTRAATRAAVAVTGHPCPSSTSSPLMAKAGLPFRCFKRTCLWATHIWCARHASGTPTQTHLRISTTTTHSSCNNNNKSSSRTGRIRRTTAVRVHPPRAFLSAPPMWGMARVAARREQRAVGWLWPAPARTGYQGRGGAGFAQCRMPRPSQPPCLATCPPCRSPHMTRCSAIRRTTCILMNTRATTRSNRHLPCTRTCVGTPVQTTARRCSRCTLCTLIPTRSPPTSRQTTSCCSIWRLQTSRAQAPLTGTSLAASCMCSTLRGMRTQSFSTRPCPSSACTQQQSGCWRGERGSLPPRAMRVSWAHRPQQQQQQQGQHRLQQRGPLLPLPVLPVPGPLPIATADTMSGATTAAKPRWTTSRARR